MLSEKNFKDVKVKLSDIHSPHPAICSIAIRNMGVTHCVDMANEVTKLFATCLIRLCQPMIFRRNNRYECVANMRSLELACQLLDADSEISAIQIVKVDEDMLRVLASTEVVGFPYFYGVHSPRQIADCMNTIGDKTLKYIFRNVATKKAKARLLKLSPQRMFYSRIKNEKYENADEEGVNEDLFENYLGSES